MSRKVLAIASSGGHWIQLERLRSAFEEFETVYLTVDASYAADLPDRHIRIVADANRKTPGKLIWMTLQILWAVLAERPHVVVSTGAAPGLIGIIFGRLLGARTVWIDSAANAERLSMSGRLVRPFASLWLTQWPHLATQDGPEFRGSVI